MDCFSQFIEGHEAGDDNMDLKSKHDVFLSL